MTPDLTPSEQAVKDTIAEIEGDGRHWMPGAIMLAAYRAQEKELAEARGKTAATEVNLEIAQDAFGKMEYLAQTMAKERGEAQAKAKFAEASCVAMREAIGVFFHHWEHGGIARDNQFHRQTARSMIKALSSTAGSELLDRLEKLEAEVKEKNAYWKSKAEFAEAIAADRLVVIQGFHHYEHVTRAKIKSQKATIERLRAALEHLRDAVNNHWNYDILTIEIDKALAQVPTMESK